MTLLTKFLAALAAALLLAGCTKDISSSTYDTGAIGTTARVESGIIASMRTIKIDQNTGVGGLAGAAAGGIAGSTIGGSGHSNAIGAIGGAVIGGVAANALEKKINQRQGTEFIIKLQNGSVISVAQASDLNLSVGQHVLVIYGATTRIVADTTQAGTFGDKAVKPAAVETVPTVITTTTQQASAAPAPDAKK